MPKQLPAIEIHDENARIVKGWGTVDVFDKANERLPIEEFKRIMPVIMKRGGLVMNRHSNQPSGKILNYEFKMKDTPSGPKEGVYLTTEVFKDFGSDDEVWEAIKKGDTEGFSFGGKNNLEEMDFSKGVSQKTLKGLEGFEFSYVPKGMNQEATIEEVNYIAKEDTGEDGETSQDSDHYHLYRIDGNRNGKTLETLPRETDEHIHNINNGIVQEENEHSHKLSRKLVNKEIVKKPFAGFSDFKACERANQDKDDPSAFCGFLQSRVEKIEEEFEKEKIQKKEDLTIEKVEKVDSNDKKENKSQSKHNLILLNSDNKCEKFIKNSILNKNMEEDKNKKPQEEVTKVEEAPIAADTPSENPMERIEEKLDKLIEVISNAQKVEEPIEVEKVDDEDEEDKPVEKEGDGEEVKLPQSEGEEVSQDKPAEGANTDEPKANFLEKEGIEKIKTDMKNEIMKELVNKKANTPRPGVVSNNILKGTKVNNKVAKNSIEANKMIREAGLR